MELLEQALVENCLYLAFCDFSGEFKEPGELEQWEKVLLSE
jgi:hypothetical protein